MVTEKFVYLAKMLDIGQDFRPRKRLRLDQDNDYHTTFNNSAECNLTGEVYSDAASGQGFSQPAPAALPDIAHTKNVYSRTCSHDTTHTMASEIYITHSTTTVQSTVAKYVGPTLTPDVSHFDASATSGYDLVSSEVRPGEEICFGAVGSPIVFYQYRTL